MTMETYTQMTTAKSLLSRIRLNCREWAVDADIDELRHYLNRTGISLVEIGASEDELQSCFRIGHETSARSWLAVAREECGLRDVSFEIGCVNQRLTEANLTLSDIGSSQDELRQLLAAHRKHSG